MDALGRTRGGSNDVNGWSSKKLNDIEVSYGREWASMDASGKDGSNNVDGWGWEGVDGVELSSENEEIGINATLDVRVTRPKMDVGMIRYMAQVMV